MASDKKQPATPSAYEKAPATGASTDIVPVTTLFPVLASDVAAMAAVAKKNLAGAEVSIFHLERIRVPGAGGLSWRVRSEDGTEDEVREIEAVVAWQGRQRAYWKEPFGKSGGGNRPDCRSLDTRTGKGDNGQGEGTHSCSRCPNSQFGTAARADGTPGGGQACSELHMFFLLRTGRQGAIFPSLMILPPGSLQNSGRWLFALTSQGVAVDQVVARFTLEQAKSKDGISFSRAKIATTRKLSKEESQALATYGEAMRETFLGYDPLEASDAIPV